MSHPFNFVATEIQANPLKWTEPCMCRPVACWGVDGPPILAHII